MAGERGLDWHLGWTSLTFSQCLNQSPKGKSLGFFQKMAAKFQPIISHHNWGAWQPKLNPSVHTARRGHPVSGSHLCHGDEGASFLPSQRLIPSLTF